jgi:hypothetical protein
MSSTSEAIRQAKEREAEDARQAENLMTVCIAALFRAAIIVNRPPLVGEEEDIHAISEAKRFVETCKSQGLWPKDVRRL